MTAWSPVAQGLFLSFLPEWSAAARAVAHAVVLGVVAGIQKSSCIGREGCIELTEGWWGFVVHIWDAFFAKSTGFTWEKSRV